MSSRLHDEFKFVFKFFIAQLRSIGTLEVRNVYFTTFRVCKTIHVLGGVFENQLLKIRTFLLTNVRKLAILTVLFYDINIDITHRYKPRRTKSNFRKVLAIMLRIFSRLTSMSLCTFNNVNPVYLRSPVLLRKHVLDLRKEENERSLVATDTWTVAPIRKNR